MEGKAVLFQQFADIDVSDIEIEEQDPDKLIEIIASLDVGATTINDEMKIAAAHALAELAREDVPDEVAAAYSGRQLRYGQEYIIPVPFDPRLIVAVPSRVAEAAIKSGVAQRPIKDMDAYRTELSARLDPIAASMQLIHAQVRANPQRVVFSEGEEPAVIRAALSYRNMGYGAPVLIGRENLIKDRIKEIGLTGAEDLEIHNARLSKKNKAYTDYLYERLQRKGYLRRDCQRMVNNDRNVFAACMLAQGDADAMVTGQTRSFLVCLEDVTRALDPKPSSELFGLSIVVSQGRTVFIADTAVHERPTAEQLADIAVQSAAKARELGHEPRVAFLSYASFGNPPGALATQVRGAVALLDDRDVDFEYDGEMSADVALDPELRSVFPFNRLSGAANVLLMPGLHAASISSKILQKLGGGSVIGPLLVGMCHPVQIVGINSSVSDLVNHASLAAHAAIKPRKPKRAKKPAKKSTRKKR